MQMRRKKEVLRLVPLHLSVLEKAEPECGWTEAVISLYRHVLPSLGLPDAVIGEMQEKWLSAPDQAPFAQLIALAKNFPDLQARTEDDVFLTPGNMALTERTVLASRPFGTPDEDYVAVAKDDDTGVRSSTFSFRSAI